MRAGQPHSFACLDKQGIWERRKVRFCLMIFCKSSQNEIQSGASTRSFGCTQICGYRRIEKNWAPFEK
jgi:hypothetical protein